MDNEGSDLGMRQLRASLAEQSSNTIELEDDSDSGSSTIYESEEEDYFSEIEDDGELEDTYGKLAYLNKCEELGIVAASQILKYLELDEVQVTHYGIGNSGMQALCAGLAKNRCVTALRLADNNLGPGGTKLAVETLTQHRPDIIDLDVSENNVKESGVVEIAKLLKPSMGQPTLVNLCLRGNKLGDKEAKIIAEAMEQNSQLSYLDVSHNCFGSLGGTYLGNMLAVNSGLTEINLAWNNLRSKGGAAIAEGLTSCLNLQIINLGWNGVADEGCKAIGDALERNNGLVELNLSCNNITHMGIKDLAEGIMKNESLASVELAQNNVGETGGLLLKEAIQANKGMVALNLRSSYVTEEVLGEIDAILATRRPDGA